MIEALWSAVFVSNVQIVGAGIVVLETGRAFGGDAQYFYVGDYSVEQGIVAATLKVTHYAGNAHSIFGDAKEFHLDLSGRPERDVFELQGHVVGKPRLQIKIRLTRRAELP
jgi:hypothetical protein